MLSRRLVCLVSVGAVLGCGSDARGLFDPAPATTPDSGSSAPDGSAGAGGSNPNDAAAGQGGSTTDASDPPDTGCEPGQTQDQPCGLNGRGTQTNTCGAGSWTAGPCVDPDVCLDGATRQMPCGANDAGTVDQSCGEGQWKDVGDCKMPVPTTGRWACSNGVCEPALGDPDCGNGSCSPQSGESPSSCPVDCGALTTQNGEGKQCGDEIDCAFYAWPHSTKGYWDCQWGPGGQACRATQTSGYCGTSGYDYCFYGSIGIETPASCPADCANQLLNQNTQSGCNSDRDCVFLDWPVN